MLVIPALDLHGGECVRVRNARYETESAYFADPVAMAKLWRVMNAKVLHLIDLDAASGTPGAPGHDAPQDNLAEVRAIASALDIPVQLSGGIRTEADVAGALDAGVYRVVFGPVTEATVDDALSAVARFGSSRVTLAIDPDHTDVPDPAALAAQLEAGGVRRIVYTDVDRTGEKPHPRVENIRRLADGLTRARVTVAGGVSGYADLLALQAIAPSGVDSVVVGRALYENAFPCQRFWCWQRPKDVDLSRFSTARLALQSHD
ncbi:MAG: HisA/HisF-related TIM barrel protein [Bacteroidota bacterium]